MARLTNFNFGSSNKNNKIINCYNILLFHVHSDASNGGVACVMDVKGKNIFVTEIPLIQKITFNLTWRELEGIQLFYSVRLRSLKKDVFFGIQTIFQLNENKVWKQ